MVTTDGYVQFYLQRSIYPNQPTPVVIRLRGGELSDTSGVHNGSAVGELIPAFEFGELIGKGVLPDALTGFTFGSEYKVGGLAFIFSPEIEAQYDFYERGPLTYALFAAHHESMRVGPVAVLKLYGFESVLDGLPNVDKGQNSFYDNIRRLQSR